MINTPIELYANNGTPYFVKREDLSCKKPGPPFAKVRGLYPVLFALKKKGIISVAYVDTAISMAGWGVSYFAQELGMKAIIYYPKYKDGYRYEQAKHIKLCQKFGATIIPIEKPQMLQINRNIAKKRLVVDFPGSYMLPSGLTFPETVEEVSKEVASIKPFEIKTIIICTGSGAMTAGIVKGLIENNIQIHTLLSVQVHKNKNAIRSKQKIMTLSGVPLRGDLFRKGIMDIIQNFEVINGDYLYEEVPQIKSPFPCNPYYDLKAYEFMINNLGKLLQPILFWNIGE